MSVGIDLDCREGIRAAGSIEFEGWPVGYQKLRLARERSQLCGEAGGQLRRRLSRQEPASAYRAIYSAVRGAPTLLEHRHHRDASRRIRHARLGDGFDRRRRQQADHG